MSQHMKTYARQGRGASNGYNENWRNSPLWDSIEAKKKKSGEMQDEETVQNKEQTDIKHEKSEESIKDKQKKMFAMVY